MSIYTLFLVTKNKSQMIWNENLYEKANDKVLKLKIDARFSIIFIVIVPSLWHPFLTGSAVRRLHLAGGRSTPHLPSSSRHSISSSVLILRQILKLPTVIQTNLLQICQYDVIFSLFHIQTTMFRWSKCACFIMPCARTMIFTIVTMAVSRQITIQTSYCNLWSNHLICFFISYFLFSNLIVLFVYL